MATSLGKELLRAPISGIIIDNHLLPGQIIQPNKPAIEIVDPSQFRIEAYTFDYIQANHIRSSWVSTIYRRVTGGFRSDWGKHLFAAVHSVVNTGQKQKLTPRQSIERAMGTEPSFLLT